MTHLWLVYYLPDRNSFLNAPVSMPASPMKVIFSSFTGPPVFWCCQSFRPLFSILSLETQMLKVFPLSTFEWTQRRTSSSLLKLVSRSLFFFLFFYNEGYRRMEVRMNFIYQTKNINIIVLYAKDIHHLSVWLIHSFYYS